MPINPNLSIPTISMATPLETTQMVLHVTIQIDPSNVEVFLKELRPVWAACCREPECLYFEVAHSPTEPGLFRFVEVWTKDKEWFLEHQITKPYYEPYLSITTPMWTADRKLEFFERVDGWNYVGDEYLKGGVRS